MQPSELSELHYLFASSHLLPINYQIPTPPCNSTSDEADDHHLSIILDRKQRRMISNRESARRSRMRKQKHLDELWSQVVWLRNENHQLMDKLNHLSQSHDQALQENAHLKEETTELRQMLSEMHLPAPAPAFLHHHPSNDLP